MKSLQPDCVCLAGRRGEEIITDDPGREVSWCVSAAPSVHEEMIPCCRNQCFVGVSCSFSFFLDRMNQTK